VALILPCASHKNDRYRRIEWCCDTDNHAGKRLAGRLGFAAEGTLRKHMVWREANRDSALYSLTNSDWREGAREALEALVQRRIKDAGLATAAAPKEKEEEDSEAAAAVAAAAASVSDDKKDK
jgi:hypothetical protein